ncbi:hypothetical protein AAKU55_003658 [Oxalobacteraceae bacterium GrIS 1.11]
MRKILLVLTSIFLAGCVDDSASYFINGRDHSLTIRRQQAYFWKKQADISLVAARMPDCQRLHQLSAVAPDVKVELFSAGDNVWNVRMGQQLWQVETNTCNGLTELQNDPKADLGQLVGTFAVDAGKLVFDAAAAPANAEAPAAQ